jgi:hypothetical protein
MMMSVMASSYGCQNGTGTPSGPWRGPEKF